MRPSLNRMPRPTLQSFARLVFALVLIGGALLGIGGLASAASTSCGSGGAAERAVCRAEQQLGDRYVWGAEGPSTFDCSGLVYYAYKGSGVGLARTTAEAQSHQGKAVSTKSLKKGDLLFFDWDDDGNVDHTGIYAGKGKMIHASSGSGKVKKVALTSYYTNHLDTARRLAPEPKSKSKPKPEAEPTTKPKSKKPSTGGSTAPRPSQPPPPEHIVLEVVPGVGQ